MSGEDGEERIGSMTSDVLDEATPRVVAGEPHPTVKAGDGDEG